MERLSDVMTLREAFLACYRVTGDLKDRVKCDHVAKAVAQHLQIPAGQSLRRDLHRTLTTLDLNLRTVNHSQIKHWLGIKPHDEEGT